MKVCEKVESKVDTSYEEVANELIADIAAEVAAGAQHRLAAYGRVLGTHLCCFLWSGSARVTAAQAGCRPPSMHPAVSPGLGLE
jgi:hypothetical protein